MIVTILATIAVLGVLIFVHELGHFLAARLFDIRVPRFSIGLGPKVFGFRRGETEYRVAALPLGGYVKVAGLKEMSALEGGGDDAGPTDDGRTFEDKSAAARAVVLSAGVVMNVVLGVALFAVVAGIWGTPVPPEPVVGDVVEEWLPEGAAALASVQPGARVVRVGGREVSTMDEVSRAISRAHAGPLQFEFAGSDPVTIRIPEDAGDRQLLPLALEPARDVPPVLGMVADGGSASRAGLRRGDRVVAVDGSPVATWQQLVRVVERNPGRALAVEVRRASGELARVELVPEEQSTVAGTVGRMRANRSREVDPPVLRERRPPVEAAVYGVTQSWDVIRSVGQFLVGLIDGRHSARELGGPVLIGQLSGMAARAGLPVLLTFVALLSINLAVINLLPIPALDGGHLLFLAVEVVRGRPASERVRIALGRAGTAFVVLLMLWVVASDVLRILGR